jgi:lysophospholipase L1-like esterase
LDRYYLSHRFFSTPPLLTSAFAAYDQGKIDDIKNLKKKFNESFSHYDKKIVVFGGSNTVGTGALDYQSTWSAFLNKMSQKDIAYISWGVLGATTEDMKHYFLETVELTKPYCVLFYIGINDSVCYQCMKENLNDFSKQLKEQGIKMVIAPEVDAEYVLSAEPMLSYKILKQFTKSSKDVSFYDIPMALKQIAQEDRGIMWSDNVHLTSYGQRKLAESILKKPFSCL